MIKDAVGEIVAYAMAHPTIGGRSRMRIRRLRLTYGSGVNIIHTAIMA